MDMKKAGCLVCSEDNVRRRNFLKAGSLSLLGMSLSQYFELKSLMAATGETVGKKAKAQACILLWLEGGPTHVDTWDPKPNSSFRPISTNVPGIQISELLPRVAKNMDKLAIIRSMHTEQIDHPQGQHYAITGHNPNAAMQFPSLGSIISKEVGPRGVFPPYVQVARMHPVYQAYFRSAFLGPNFDPMVIPDPSQKNFEVPDLSLPKTLTPERVEDRRSFQRVVDHLFRQKEEIAEYSNMDSFTEQALKIILSPSVKKAFDLSLETDKTKDAYGRHSFGQSVLLARRLVEGGCRFVTAAGWKFNEWDQCHKSNDMFMRETLVPRLDQALGALVEDLDQRGLLESTVVIAMGEFGRTPHVNPDNGRDHWPHCWSLVLGGGGIKGGQVVGASDAKGAQVAEKIVSIGDVFATIYDAFGINWEKEYMTPTGRPIKIANAIGDKTGSLISELV